MAVLVPVGDFTAIVINLAGPARKVTNRGRHYLVVPGTLIVPGVLNGSRGALYYPKSEVAKNDGVWNGTPITVGHPTDPITNSPVSGRDPDVLERVGIGYVFNDRIGRVGQRMADLYFDIEYTYNYDRKYGTDILWRVENNLPIELSTGLYTDNEPARNGARDEKGRAYDFIARNYRPDHLAILVNDRGACSVDDGCGVNVHNTNLKVWPVVIPSFTMLHNFGSGQSAAIAALETLALNTDDRAQTDPAWNAEAEYQLNKLAGVLSTTIVVNGHARLAEVHRRLERYTSNREIEFCPDCGSVMDECECGYARNLTATGTGMSGSPIKIGLGGGEDAGGEPVTSNEGGASTSSQSDNIIVGEGFVPAKGPTEKKVDNDCGGHYETGTTKNDGDSVDPPYKIEPLRKGDVLANTSGGMDDATWDSLVVQNSGGHDMPLTVNQRKGIVDDLCVNCKCYAGQEKILNQLPDDNLIRLKEQFIQSRNNAVIADTVKNGLRIRDTAGKLVTVNAGIKNGELVVNAFGQGNDSGKAEGSNAGASQSAGPAQQVGGEEDDPAGHAGEHASVAPETGVKAQDVAPGHGVQNAVRNDPTFRNLSPSLQHLLLTNAKREDDHRRRLAEQLVPSHLPQQTRNRLVGNKLKMSTEDLELEVQTFVGNYAAPLQVGPIRQVPSYAGAGVTANGGGYQITDNSEADLLDLPKMEW